jgi:hypothetical protein
MPHQSSFPRILAFTCRERDWVTLVFDQIGLGCEMVDLIASDTRASEKGKMIYIYTRSKR